MKSFLVVLSVFVALGFVSCRTQTLAPDAGTATIKGQALLAHDLSDNPAGQNPPSPPFGGIQVTLEGTNFSTITDDSGLFELDKVPAGTYDVRFSKAGYGDIRWFGVTVQGGGNAPIYWNQGQVWHNLVPTTLFEQPNFVNTLQAIHVNDTSVWGYPRQQVIWLDGRYSGQQPGYYHQTAVFFSHHPNVSSLPGSYEWFECWGTALYVWDTLSMTFHIPVSMGYYQLHGFKSGDSVYFATYGAPYWGQTPYYDYYDPTIRQPVLTSINQTPSPVIGFKVP